VKLGRFVTLQSNEVIDAPGNWNYSRSYIYNAESLYHTGALLSYKWNDIVDTQIAVVNGFSEQSGGIGTTSDNNSAKSVTGRLGVTLLGGQLVLSTIGFAGADPNPNGYANYSSGNNGVLWLLDEVITYNPKWNEKWTFALEALYARDTKLAANIAGVNTAIPEAAWWGVAGYTKYQWLPQFSTALRVESFNFNGSALGVFNWSGVPIGSASGVGGPTLAQYGAKGHVEDVTLSCSFDNIWKNLTPRLEVRYDRINPSMFGNGTDGYNHNGIFTASLDIIYAF